MKADLDDSTRTLVVMWGKKYKPAILPADIKRGKLGMCFDWCALQTAELNPKYRYVEGIASSPEDNNQWILHAWMTDGVHAFDPTWSATQDFSGKEVPMPSEYIGIEFNIFQVFNFMKLTGYQGLLANRWRAPEFWDSIKQGIET